MEEKLIAHISKFIESNGSGLRDNTLDTSKDLNFYDLDSLDKVELIMELEQEFEVYILDTTLETTKNIQDLIDVIVKLKS